MSSISYPSATAKKAIHCLKWGGGGFKTNGSIIKFWLSMQQCTRRSFRKLHLSLHPMLLANRWCLLLQTPSPVPFGICIWDHSFLNLSFFRTLRLEHPSILLFCLALDKKRTVLFVGIFTITDSTISRHMLFVMSSSSCKEFRDK